MSIRTIVEFEAHDDGFLPWDFALDGTNTVVGKSPYAGQRVIGFAPQGDMQADLVLPIEGWQGQVAGLVPVLVERGAMYQLTSHVVRRARPFGGQEDEDA